MLKDIRLVCKSCRYLAPAITITPPIALHFNPRCSLADANRLLFACALFSKRISCDTQDDAHRAAPVRRATSVFHTASRSYLFFCRRFCRPPTLNQPPAPGMLHLLQRLLLLQLLQP